MPIIVSILLSIVLIAIALLCIAVIVGFVLEKLFPTSEDDYLESVEPKSKPKTKPKRYTFINEDDPAWLHYTKSEDFRRRFPSPPSPPPP